jgi:hypothetical protein
MLDQPLLLAQKPQKRLIFPTEFPTAGHTA